MEFLVLRTAGGENIRTQQLLADVLTREGISSVARGYSHDPIPSGCKMAIEHDSSLRDESRFSGLSWSKIEAKTAPMSFRELEQVLPHALEVINYFAPRLNASCGLHCHVHLEAVTSRPLVVRNLQHLYVRYAPVIYGMVAASRRRSSYCVPPEPEDARMYDGCTTYAKLCQRLSRATRYSGLNLTNLTNRERLTVEWRMHSGTTEWAKIQAWVLFCTQFVRHATVRSCHHRPDQAENTQQSLKALMTVIGMRPNTRIYNQVDKDLRRAAKYLLRRWKAFNLPGKHKGHADAKASVQAA